MTIGEVSKKYDLSLDTLRYYERAGLIPSVPRNKSGLRDYDEETCRWIQLAKCMRAAGMPIEALAEYVSLFKQGDETLIQRRDLLVKNRNELETKMADLQAAINRLDQKLAYYDKYIEEYLATGRNNNDVSEAI